MNPKKETPAQEWLNMHRAKTEKLINDIQESFNSWERAQRTPTHPTGHKQ